MLLAIREKVTGVVALVFVGVIALLMVVPLLYDYVSGAGRKDAVKINGDAIPMAQFDHRVNEETRRLLQAYGNNLPNDVDVDAIVKEQAVDAFIDSTLLEQATVKDGFIIAEADLKRIVMDMPQFQKNGKFDPALYEREFAAGSSNKAYFEQVTAQNEARKQFVGGIVRSAFALPSQVEQYAQLQYQSRNFDYVVLDAKKIEATQTVTDADIEAYYEKNKSTLTFPETAVAEFIHVKLDDFSKTIDISDADVLAEYESGQKSGRYQIPEVRSARHILLSLNEDATEEQVEAKRKEALAVIERINAGEDFATLAKELSADTGSAVKGGDLGQVVRGVMVPAFENAVYSQALNEVGAPVKTRYGFHIIRVDQIEEAKKKPLADVREQITTSLRASLAKSDYDDVLVKLADLAEENPDELKTVAEELGLTMKTSDEFTRESGTDVFSNPSVRRLAFSESVLLESLNSEVFDVSETDSIVLRIKTHNEAREKTLDEARQEITSLVLKQKTETAVNELADTLLNELKAGTSLNALAAKNDLTVKQEQGITRLDSKSVTPSLVRSVFATQHPENNQPAFGQALLPNQDKAVFALTSVENGRLENLSEGEQNRLRNQLRGAQGNSDFTSTLKSLRNAADIWVNPELVTAK